MMAKLALPFITGAIIGLVVADLIDPWWLSLLIAVPVSAVAGLIIGTLYAVAHDQRDVEHQHESEKS